jgi:UDP-N-acetylmuramyl pentapeptide phosphotransferase/UDP-N-acetylglucosamine-1-phosphate transferase
VSTGQLIALLVGVTLTSAAVAKWLAASSRIGVDSPQKGHSVHTRPTPRLGGVAIIASLLLGTAVSAWALGASFDATAIATVAATALLFVVCVLEDTIGVTPAKRLAFQATVAASWIYATSSSAVLSTRFAVPEAAMFPLLVIVLLWAMNLFNFMDGLDGLATGMAFTGFLVLAVLGFFAGDPPIGLIAAVTAASCAGFLLLNFPPASIFLGDGGSVPLGFLGFALAMVQIGRDGLQPAVPLLLYAPFVIDASVTLVLRAIRGARVWQPHREHWYQKILLAGWSHGGVLAVYYPLMIVSAASAIAYQHLSASRLTLVLVVLSAHALVGIFALFAASRSQVRAPH